MDMTPLELARELGFSYLFDILSPVIRNPVPLGTLMGLQERFHNIIRSDLGDRVEDERIYLPVLEVLTEIGDEAIWFPVKFTFSAAVCFPIPRHSVSHHTESYLGLCLSTRPTRPYC